MFEMTPTGFRIVFEKQQNPFMDSILNGYMNLLSDIWDFVSSRTLFAPNAGERFLRTMQLTKTSADYFSEMQRCTLGEAWFSAAIIGCSVVESVLMIACMRNNGEVTKTASWKRFAASKKKKGKLFRDLALWLDFGSMISIGKELGWFPEGEDFSINFINSYGAMEEVMAECPQMILSPAQAILNVHEMRNRLHPGKCIRDKFVSNDQLSKASVGWMYLSLVGVLHTFRREPDGRIEIRFPEAYLKLLKGVGVEFPEPTETVLDDLFLGNDSSQNIQSATRGTD